MHASSAAWEHHCGGVGRRPSADPAGGILTELSVIRSVASERNLLSVALIWNTAGKNVVARLRSA